MSISLFWLLMALVLVCSRAGKDFYKILGVNRSASDDEIKKAYKKRALKYHPDKNPDTDTSKQFSDVANAYEVLSDPEKRRIYDLRGEEALKSGMGGGGQQFNGFPGGFTFDPFEMFEQFFGNDGGGGFQGERFGMGGGGCGRGGGGGCGAGGRGGGANDIYSAGSPVAKLSLKKFPKAGSKYLWLVQFYSPGCIHCKNSVTAIEQAADALSGLVKFGVVNCQTQSALCSQNGINMYPTVHVVIDGKSEEFQGGRLTKDSLIEFVQESVNSKNVVNIRHDDGMDMFLTQSCKNVGCPVSDICIFLLCSHSG